MGACGTVFSIEVFDGVAVLLAQSNNLIRRIVAIWHGAFNSAFGGGFKT